MAADEPIRQGPSLRITSLAITNFRSFRARTVLPFSDGSAEPDAIVTLHGDNGTGKSNAIAALDKFFLALTVFLEGRDDDVLLAWDGPSTADGRQLVASSRDRPAGVDEPTDLEVCFRDPRLGTIRVRFIPSGRRFRLRAERRVGDPTDASSVADADGFVSLRREERDQLLTWLQTPRGTQSRPLAILDERRRPAWLARDNHGALLHSALAEELLAVRTNLDPGARERWRAFGETLQMFPQFRGKVIEIQRTKPDLPPDIIVEEPRRTVLRLDELSSGEQQLLVLYASVALADAPIVVIEEPELSLDDKNQRTFRDLIKELVKAGQIDQIIIESHVPVFDGEHVLRFRRSSTGSTEVERGARVGPEDLDLRRRAREQNAHQRWITRDGYAQLPDNMLRELEVKDGAHVWFVKGPRHWEAWPEAELNELFRDDELEAPDA